MFCMRYSIIFFQVYLQDGNAHIPFIMYINLFLFLSQEDKKGIYVSLHLPRSELKPGSEQINSRMQHILPLMACGYASHCLSTMRDQDHRLRFLVIPLVLFCFITVLAPPSYPAKLL